MNEFIKADQDNPQFCQPPHCLESESQVLGAMILDPDCIDIVTKIVRRGYFYSSSHQIIYHTIVDMHNRSVKIDPAELCRELERLGLVDDIGGPTRIAELVESVKLSANADAYARIVRDKACLRRMIVVLSRM